MGAEIDATGNSDGQTHVRVYLYRQATDEEEEKPVLSAGDPGRGVYLASGDSLVATNSEGQTETLILGSSSVYSSKRGTLRAYEGTLRGNAAGEPIRVDLVRQNAADASAAIVLPTRFTVENEDTSASVRENGGFRLSWSDDEDPETRMSIEYTADCGDNIGRFHLQNVRDDENSALMEVGFLDENGTTRTCEFSLKVNRTLENVVVGGDWMVEARGIQEVSVPIPNLELPIEKR